MSTSTLRNTRSTKIRRTGLAASALILAGTLAACGSDDSEGAAEPMASDDMSMTPSEDMSSDMAAAGDQTFGDACSAIPATGAGSFDGMVQDPVATAASNNPLLSTLVTAVTEADLVDTLNGAEGLTVFAPTNDAFDALGTKTLNQVLADKDMLTTILTHHVIEGQLDPMAVVGTQDTLAGDTITIEGDESGMTVEGATVLCGNIPTANATVYVIDSVLVPGQ
ncbi:fasciclin domain-containing protein [soil metagenome]